MSISTASAVRLQLVDALRLDLVGPNNDHAFANELLPESPTRWYLTRFLVPRNAPEEQRADPDVTDEIDSGGDSGGDDAAPPDRAAAGKSYLPSSTGVSVLVPAGVDALDARVVWGDYQSETLSLGEGEEGDTRAPVVDAATDGGSETSCDASSGTSQTRWGYRRTRREATLALDLAAADGPPRAIDVPASRGLKLVVTCRAVTHSTRLAAGVRSASVFLVNEREPDPDHGYRAIVFQAGLILRSPAPFVARPDLGGSIGGELVDERDEQVGDLQYRDVFEYAVGHGVAADAVTGEDGGCHEVCSNWLPTAEVERVEPAQIPGVELGMEVLATVQDGADAQTKLMPLVQQYRDWIAAQRKKCSGLGGTWAQTANGMLADAENAASRIEAGIGLLADPEVRKAFRVANRAMAAAARRRAAQIEGCSPTSVALPRWRPFQLAYILLTLRGIAEPTHGDRDIVDLLFFPTGGGKTEAYLGLAAFTLVLRRLRHPGLTSAGVSVLMRYTLRLLTLDQTGRAAAVICALELERETDDALGPWPFEIGLWVGSAATPNRMGYRGYDGPGRDDTAYQRTNRYKRDPKRWPRPIPLENCPWCGSELTQDSFRLTPNPNG